MRTLFVYNMWSLPPPPFVPLFVGVGSQWSLSLPPFLIFWGWGLNGPFPRTLFFTLADLFRSLITIKDVSNHVFVKFGAHYVSTLCE